MSSYTRWQVLNESLGFPLGVTTAASLGISGGFQAFEEKKKKMDIGDEVPADDGEESAKDADDDEGEAKGKKLPPWLKKKGGDEPDGDEGGCGCSCGKTPHTEFCKKKCKKKSKKQMQAEMFDGYQDCQYKEFPEVGSDEYRASFFKSLEGHMGHPGKRWDSGVNLEEEILFEPKNEQDPMLQPGPGQIGYAPVGRVGGVGSEQAPQQNLPAWEQDWKPVAEQMESLIEQWDRVRAK
jgi:hypothetical protein